MNALVWNCRGWLTHKQFVIWTL
ncbi:hypothetical protein HU200_047616 [Digitaria exilis]|uniref:Uncharacterized protein n=1 Tax=Digitaria exilis TaxID=1010633 RepID=A0A835AWU8_9POAL|nr:hypothetical protein HU200_047616 [Digitaria exilis]